MGSHRLTITRTSGPGVHRVTASSPLPRASLVPVAAPGSESYYATYNEGGGADVKLSFNLATTDASNPALTLAYTLGGTAEAGVHYEMLTPTPLSLSSGQPTGSIWVRPLDAGGWHAEKRLEVTLTATADARVEGYPRTFYVFIRSPRPMPGIAFQAVSQSAGAGSVTLTAELDVVASDDVTLAYRVNEAETSVDAADYTISDSTVTVSAGTLTGTNTLTIGGGASAGETLRLEARNDPRTAKENEWTFSETWAQETVDETQGTAQVLYPAYAADGLWVNGITQLSDGTNPDGSGSAALLVVADGSTATPYYTKSVRALLQDSNGDDCGGTTQRLGVQAANLLTFYVRQPTAVARRADHFAIVLQDRDAGIQHRAVFRWAGGAPVLDSTANLEIGGGLDQATVLALQEYDNTDAGNGWYRVGLLYRGVAGGSNAAKGVTGDGDIGNFIERRFYPFWPSDTQTVANSAGRGTVVAWPQFERAEIPTKYQPQADQWGNSPWGATGDTDGYQSHVITVT